MKVSRVMKSVGLGGLLLGVAGQPWFWWQSTDARLGYSAPDLLSVSFALYPCKGLLHQMATKIPWRILAIGFLW